MATRDEPSDGLTRLEELMDGPEAGGRAAPQADPGIRARRRRRRRIAGGIVIVVVLAVVGSYVGVTLTAPIGAAAATTRLPDVVVPDAADVALSPEGESAISVAGADAYLGKSASAIWESSGQKAALPIASISKLITAMVVLSAKPLKSASDPGPTLVFDKADHALYDKYYLLNATIAAMPTGSSMSEHDALETMLVVSACNYAESVADWAFGSNAGFVTATRHWLSARGSNHTRMVEPTGIDAGNTSTPTDLIALGKIAMANPVVASIVAKTSLDVPALKGMPNTNDLVGTDGVTGIKTGTLDPHNGSNLLFSAQLDVGLTKPVSVIGVVIGGYTHESVDADVVAMLHSISAGFHQVPLGSLGQVVGSYRTRWGAKADLVLDKSASILTWSDTAVTSNMTTTTLKTGADGEAVGSITWTAGATTVTVPLVLQGSIRPPSEWWRLTHPFDLGK